jgi:DnaK suppressor protein
MMNQEAKKQIKEQIQRDIVALEEQIRLLERRCQPIPLDCSLGNPERFEAIYEQEVNQKILRENRTHLSHLTHTLTQIDKESFGICIECEDEIPLERMLIRPEGIRCVGCSQLSTTSKR